MTMEGLEPYNIVTGNGLFIFRARGDTREGQDPRRASAPCTRRRRTGMERSMKKALISVTGLDATGIIARVATKLSELNINILDISQTILGGYFTMMMIVDLSGSPADFDEINRAMQPLREELKMEIHIQRMDIFDAMHRV